MGQQTHKPLIETMSEGIYHAKISPRLQAAVRESAAWSEFTYKDDPEFAGFCKAIQKEVEFQKIERPGTNGPERDTVRKNKLYGVWYTASTFRKHWQHPTGRSQNDILWILYNRNWSVDQGWVAIVAWWRLHHRPVNEAGLRELECMANRVWKEVQQKKMKKKIQAQQNSLRNRILAFLRQQPATTAYLAEQLKATSKAVDSHLYRLRKENIVERLSWGLYRMPQRCGTGTPTVAPGPPISPACGEDGLLSTGGQGPTSEQLQRLLKRLNGGPRWCNWDRNDLARHLREDGLPHLMELARVKSLSELDSPKA